MGIVIPVPAICKLETFRRMLGNVECETAVVVVNVIAVSGLLILLTLFAVLIKIRFVKVQPPLIIFLIFAIDSGRSQIVINVKKYCV